MTNHWRHATLILALLCFALPLLADEPESDERVPEEDKILGAWYPQPRSALSESGAPTMHFVFEADGVYKFVTNKHELVGKYRHDVEQKKITMLTSEDKVIAEFTYAFQGEVLVTTSKIDAERNDVTEYTRNPEGAEKHQKMRKEKFHGSSREAVIKSIKNMRRIFLGAVTFSNSNRDIFPKSIGVVLEAEFILPENLLVPWGQAKVPKDFGKQTVAEQTDWANRNTGYLFLLAGEEFKIDPERLALLELPTQEAPKTVSVMFENAEGKVITYAEADKLIKKQTGHTIADWMETTSPGTGEMIVPKPEAK